MKTAKIIEKNGIRVIDFPCAKFKQYLVDKFDKDGDGEISLEEAKFIKYVDLWHCTKKGTSPDDPPLGFPIEAESLAGIEYFENLQGLGCVDCKIKGALDLSKNYRLRDVSCSGNEITELILGELPELICLYCEDNLLTNLDLSGAPELAVLDCSGNKIKELDITHCKNLEHLFFKDNAKRFHLILLKTQVAKIK